MNSTQYYSQSNNNSSYLQKSEKVAKFDVIDLANKNNFQRAIIPIKKGIKLDAQANMTSYNFYGKNESVINATKAYQVPD